MSINQDRVYDNEEITNTSDHTSSQVYNGEFVIKTLIIENELNQTATFQCQGSANADFSNPFDIGSTWDVEANSNIFQSCDTYIPYWRVIVSCATAPTTGDLTVIVLGVHGGG